MVGMKTKFRNKLQLSNSVRLKITRIDVDERGAPITHASL
jgi:hypothetical protein